MSEPKPYDKSNFDDKVESEYILDTPDDLGFDCFVGNDFKYPDEIKHKAKSFHFVFWINLVIK